jgi:hypothetical protein
LFGFWKFAPEINIPKSIVIPTHEADIL